MIPLNTGCATRRKADRRLITLTDTIQIQINKRWQLPFTLAFTVFLSFFKLNLISGQDIIGVDICACQPATYTFTLNFDLVCSDTNVLPGMTSGINATACLTEIRDEEGDDDQGSNNEDDEALKPVSVQNVQIFELDQSLQVIAQTVRTGPFVNSSTFTYTSIIATLTADLDPSSLPRGIQLVSTGLNSIEQAVVNTYIILYNNDCGIFPLLFEGDRAGWTEFVSSLRTRFFVSKHYLYQFHESVLGTNTSFVSYI